MHADLKWLAENVSEWGGTYSFKHIFLKDGVADYSSVPDVVLRTFTRAQWQAAREKLSAEAQEAILRQVAPSLLSKETTPEEDEAWAEAERRMDAMNSTYNHWQHPTDDITAYDPPGPTSMPECTFTTPDEEEAWREVEKKINPVWQSPHDAVFVCVFHGCRYSAHERCYMCVLAGEAVKEEAKQARYQDTAGEDWIDEAARTFTAEEFRGAMRFSIGKYNRRMGKKDDLASEIEKMRDYCSRWLKVEQGR